MKTSKLCLFSIAMMVIGLVIGYTQSGYALPHDQGTGTIFLKDAAGVVISASSTSAYSPKQTCGTSGCHIYESDVAFSTKDHGVGTTAYQVPYPQHGVTAGYHFQQGRNLDWGNAQREFFHQADFTSSGGMYGKY